MANGEIGQEKLTRWVRQERETLTNECYAALGWRVWSRTKENSASPMAKTVFVREDTEPATLAAKRARCEAVLAEIEVIDKNVERYYLERVVLVGLAGAVCIGLSFLFLHLGLHVVFTLSLLLGIFGCSITLALRLPLTRLGLRKLGGGIPALEARLAAILEEDRK